MVDPDASSESSTAFLTRSAASDSPRKSSSNPALMIAAAGIRGAGARDVGGRTVHRLEERRSGPGRVQVRRGGPPDPAGDRPTEVGEDVAEEVVGDDDVVPLGSLDEVDARGVDMVVAGRHLGVVRRDLVEGPLPEVTRERQDVGLVHEREVTAGPRLGEIERVPHTPLDAEAGVHRSLRRDLTGRVLAEEAALPRVRALGVLADHDHVDAVVERARPGDERPQVHEEVELEAEPQEQAALDDAGRHLGSADRTEQDRVEAAELLERLVRQHLAGAEVVRAAQVVGHRVELDAGRAHHLQRFGDHLGTDAVTGDDSDLVAHGPGLLRGFDGSESPGQRKTAHRGGRSRANAGVGVRLGNDDDEVEAHGPSRMASRPTGVNQVTPSPWSLRAFALRARSLLRSASPRSRGGRLAADAGPRTS